MATGDLVQLATVKSWLGVTSAADDALLSSLISQISRAIYNYINRSFVLPANVTEAYDGSGRESLILRNWPVGAIGAVVVDGKPIPPAPLMVAGVHPAPGYVLEQADDQPPGAMQQLFLRGPYRFHKGRQNVVVTYRSGYEIVSETQSVPMQAPFQLTAFSPYGVFAEDTGVAYANGAALKAVAANPTGGQYTVDPTSGTYGFSAADAGATLSISYGYIPADLAQCALEWVADRYRYKDRIGVSSRSLGGQETTSYQNRPVPDFVAASLVNFRRIIAN
jgi:hypothetical protein